VNSAKAQSRAPESRSETFKRERDEARAALLRSEAARVGPLTVSTNAPSEIRAAVTASSKYKEERDAYEWSEKTLRVLGKAMEKQLAGNAKTMKNLQNQLKVASEGRRKQRPVQAR